MLALLLVPAIAFAPTAHACRNAAPLADVGGYYVVPAGSPKGPVAVRSDTAGANTGLTVAQCLWTGAGVEVWQESNGHAGLQTSATYDCQPDLLVVGAQGAVTRQCMV